MSSADNLCIDQDRHNLNTTAHLNLQWFVFCTVLPFVREINLFAAQSAGSKISGKGGSWHSPPDPRFLERGVHRYKGVRVCFGDFIYPMKMK